MLNAKNRPRIKIPLQISDFAVEAVCGTFLILIILLPIMYWNELPSRIPSHFNFNGSPNRFGSKNSLIALPILAFVLNLGLTILSRAPHLYNYPVKITEANAENMYRVGSRSMRWLKTALTMFLCYLTYGSINTAMGNATGLNRYVLILYLSSLAIIIGVVIFSGIKNRSPKKNS